jgi:hypothetical protein
MIEIYQLAPLLDKVIDIYQDFDLIAALSLRHCVTVSNALSGSRVTVTSHTASLNLYLAPHTLPAGPFVNRQM